MLITIGIVIGVVLTILFICVAYSISEGACSEKGAHEWKTLGRVHGKYTIKWQGGDNLKVDGYVELDECQKCKRRKASRWLDWHDDEYGGLQEADVPYAESLLRKAGVLKE